MLSPGFWDFVRVHEMNYKSIEIGHHAYSIGLSVTHEQISDWIRYNTPCILVCMAMLDPILQDMDRYTNSVSRRRISFQYSIVVCELDKMLNKAIRRMSRNISKE
jgi:hypothetical protein